MKKKLGKVSFLCAALVTVMSSVAATAQVTVPINVTLPTPWTNEFIPTAAQAGDNGKVVVEGATYPSGWNLTKAGNPGCYDNGSLLFKTDGNNVLSLALAAMLSGKKVKCWVTTTCEGSFPVAKFCRIAN